MFSSKFPAKTKTRDPKREPKTKEVVTVVIGMIVIGIGVKARSAMIEEIQWIGKVKHSKHGPSTWLLGDGNIPILDPSGEKTNEYSTTSFFIFMCMH